TRFPNHIPKHIPSLMGMFEVRVVSFEFRHRRGWDHFSVQTIADSATTKTAMMAPRTQNGASCFSINAWRTIDIWGTHQHTNFGHRAPAGGTSGFLLPLQLREEVVERVPERVGRVEKLDADARHPFGRRPGVLARRALNHESLHTHGGGC